MRGEREIQCFENNDVGSNAGRYRFPKYRALNHNVGHDAHICLVGGLLHLTFDVLQLQDHPQRNQQVIDAAGSTLSSGSGGRR